MTTEDRARLRALLEKASPQPPWYFGEVSGIIGSSDGSPGSAARAAQNRRLEAMLNALLTFMDLMVALVFVAFLVGVIWRDDRCPWMSGTPPGGAAVRCARESGHPGFCDFSALRQANGRDR